MVESLRARLLLWYALILALVIATFGATVCYLFWRSLLAGAEAELQTRAEAVGRVLRPAGAGTFDLDLPEDAIQYFNQQSGDRPYYAIWNAAGQLIDRSDPEIEVPQRPPERRTRAGRHEVAITGENGVTILVGRDISDLQREVWALGGTIAGTGAVALAISLLGGWFLSGRALAPIARISGTARAMSEGDLSARVPIDRTESELGQLASALNSAFDRLQQVLERQRRFTADASHELRTPLATVSAETEWALSRERQPDQYRASFETVSRAAARMRAVVDALLSLARADARELKLQPTAVPLGSVIEDVITVLRPAAEARNIAIHVQGQDVQVLGDAELLRQVVSNLVSNAIQYNCDGGRVDIAMWPEGQTVCLRVGDTGIGIAAEELSQVFERFYRADKARARVSGGTGLGLALAKWIVEAHRGDISCTSEIDRGTEFFVRLPAAPA